MTTLGIGRSDRVKVVRTFGARGFTLLEVALALFIVLLVLGLAMPFAGSLTREASLHRPADELKLLAITARRLAVTEHKTYEIILDRDRYMLRQLPIGSGDEEEKDKQRAEVRDDEILKSYEVPRDIAYQVKRWDENDFGKKTESQWRFLPTGICEPITVRFTRESDWILFSFNPLTANAEDEAIYFP